MMIEYSETARRYWEFRNEARNLAPESPQRMMALTAAASLQRAIFRELGDYAAHEGLMKWNRHNLVYVPDDGEGLAVLELVGAQND